MGEEGGNGIERIGCIILRSYHEKKAVNFLMQIWQLPKTENILERRRLTKNNEAFYIQKASIIESALAAFNVPGKIVEILQGPSITWFGFEPEWVQKRNVIMTRGGVGLISSLAVDIGVALASPIQINELMPGKNYVAIGIPNEEVFPVSLRNVMESAGFSQLDGSLSLGLGVDIFGNPVSYDLAKFPHLLISGTTGSGKSMCVNAIIACLLFQNTPDDLRLFLVDTKKVELTHFNGIPHLLGPVESEVKRVVGGLIWLTREMGKRYDLFAKVGVRDFGEFNTLMRAKNEKKMPYLLTIIDDITDLMMIERDQVEPIITRLTQIGFVAGIHFVLTAQLPSVEMLHGFIKSNFPVRIAFRVASAVDSRVILGQPGAEKLAGHGDMLIRQSDSLGLLRIQGAYISDSEMNLLLNHWKDF